MIAKKADTRLILDNIRSVHNVGSIFRTADTLGISHIYSVGTTPTPTDRFNRKRKDFTKVSLGAEDSVPWSYCKDISDSIKLIKSLKKEGFNVVALEQSLRAIDYKQIKINSARPSLANQTLVILGNEVTGVSKELLGLADVIAEIPMKGKKESLNVSVATGIFLYRLFDR